MPNNHSAFKRSELAQCYFPDLKPMSAWEKFKDWMDASARLRPLLSLTRRTSRQRRYSLSTMSWASPENTMSQKLRKS